MIRLRRAAVLIAAVLLGGTCAVAIAAAGHPTAVVSHAKPAKCHRVSSARHHRRICRAVRHRAKPPAQAMTGSATGRPPAHPAVVVVPPVAMTTATTTSTGTPPPPPPTSPALPNRVAVDLYEYAIVVGHLVVAAGTVELSVSNIGQDDHDLVIAQHGVVIGQTQVLHPGAPASTIVVSLTPGTYTLYCALYNHAQIGMTATLVAK